MTVRISISSSTEYLDHMRRIFHVSALCLAAAGVSACEPDGVIPTQVIPTAGVRFIHAVPDTGAMDFRFVDFVESNAHWNVAFRSNPVMSPTGANGVPASTLVQFKNARAGQRQFRIFMSGTTPAVASTVVKDTIVILEADKNYTALLWGYANPTGPGRPAGAPAMRLTFFEETVASPGAQVALRVINAHTTAIDVRYYDATTGTAPGTVLATNVLPLTRSNYVTTAPAQFRYNVQPAGGGAVLFTDRIALIGAAAVTGPPGPFDALPGTTVAGSAVTAIVFPPSVTGSGAPQGAGSASIPSWTAPAITYVWDRRPPRPAGT